MKLIKELTNHLEIFNHAIVDGDIPPNEVLALGHKVCETATSIMIETTQAYSSYVHNTKKHTWKQSTFVKNCPIYYVNKTDGSGSLMKIEFDVLGKTNRWTIEVLNGFAKSLVAGHINDHQRVKILTEQLLKQTLAECRNVA